MKKFSQQKGQNYFNVNQNSDLDLKACKKEDDLRESSNLATPDISPV